MSEGVVWLKCLNCNDYTLHSLFGITDIRKNNIADVVFQCTICNEKSLYRFVKNVK